MADSTRVVCKLFVKTVADRRVARPIEKTLPGEATDFTTQERDAFRELDRRGKVWPELVEAPKRRRA